MATTTINTSAAEDARISAAFGALLNLQGNANQAQVKAQLGRYMTEVVRGYEQQQAINAAMAGTTPIAPT